MGERIMENIAYFDNSATTKPSEKAVEAMLRALRENWANPSSLYDIGMNAQLEMDKARRAAANLIGANADEIYFTSGGTEANNIAIFGAYNALCRRGNRIVTTAIEHPSVQNCMDELEKNGAQVIRLNPDKNGVIPVDDIARAVDKNTVLVSMMLVNNETGAIQPVKAAAGAIRQCGAPALLHCDCVQAFGKMPIKVSSLGADLITASGHKIHGPKGVGILYKRKSARVLPRTFGGGQEKNIRPGTESTPLIAGLLGAIEDLPNIPAQLDKIKELRDYAASELADKVNVQINSPEDALPYVLNVSVPGIRSEIMLHFLESRGVYVSSGSACAKGEASYVLRAMGVQKALADSAVRISFSRYNTKQQVDMLVSAVCDASQILRHR